MAKAILVAGGAGYIGSHIARLLAERGYQPIIYDNLSTGHEELVGSHTFVEGDICDVELVKNVLVEHKVQAVMDFASFIAVGESVKHPLMYYENNVGRTLAFLQAVSACEIENFIFSSTAAVYGTPGQTPIEEEHPLRPESPYGHGKLMIEQVLSDIERAGGLRHVNLRYFNAAGAHPSGDIGELHEPETHLIPLALRAVHDHDFELTVFGDDYDTPDGTCIRDYIHVCDLAEAHMAALEYLLKGGQSASFNLGNGNGFSVMQVLDAVAEATGTMPKHKIGHRRPGDPPLLVASSEKARSILSWQPSFGSLAEIVRTAWDFEKKRKL